MKPVFIGVDPDLHDTGIAVATIDEVLWCGVAHIPQKLKGPDAVRAMITRIAEVWRWDGGCTSADHLNPSCWVEAQKVYTRFQDASPNGLISLAQVAGGAVALLQGSLVLPEDWKGQVEKHIDQKRTYDYYKWESELVATTKSRKSWYQVPTDDRFKIKRTAWKHVGDALGIALWAAKEHKKQERREAALKEP